MGQSPQPWLSQQLEKPGPWISENHGSFSVDSHASSIISLLSLPNIQLQGLCFCSGQCHLQANQKVSFQVVTSFGVHSFMIQDSESLYSICLEDTYRHSNSNNNKSANRSSMRISDFWKPQSELTGFSPGPTTYKRRHLDVSQHFPSFLPQSINQRG